MVLRRRQPGGRLRETTVPVGAARGEDRPQLAHAEGLPVAGSQPLPGVSQALGGGPGRPPGSMPAAAAPTQALSDGRALDSDYLQALATSTMVRIDDRPDRAMGWPLLSYCRAGVRALQCHHNDLWLRNRLNGGAEASDIASFDGTQASAFDAMGYSQGVNATVRALRAVWVLSVRPLR